MTNLKKRCGSCEHKWKYHSGDGCWFTVQMGRPEKDLVCACRVPWVPGEPEIEWDLYALEGWRTVGCDCHHTGMGPKWHLARCKWKTERGL